MMKSVTKEKVFHVLKMILLAITVTLVLLSLLGTVVHNKMYRLGYANDKILSNG